MLSAAALAAAINAPAQTPRLAHTVVAGEVYDLDSQRVLYARNANMLMVPASTTKLLTEGTSLALLGPNFRWTTPVYRIGPLDAQGVLHGGLVLVASGDPNFRSGFNPTVRWRSRTRTTPTTAPRKPRPCPAIRLPCCVISPRRSRRPASSESKAFEVDTSLFPDQGAEDGTGTTLSPIVVNDNLVDVTLTPGARPGRPGQHQVSPQTPYVQFINRATTSTPKAMPRSI